jgi:hypothetical protein
MHTTRTIALCAIINSVIVSGQASSGAPLASDCEGCANENTTPFLGVVSGPNNSQVGFNFIPVSDGSCIPNLNAQGQFLNCEFAQNCNLTLAYSWNIGDCTAPPAGSPDSEWKWCVEDLTNMPPPPRCVGPIAIDTASGGSQFNVSVKCNQKVTANMSLTISCGGELTTLERSIESSCSNCE